MSKRQPTRPRLRTALLAVFAAGTALLSGAAERYVATSGNNSDGSSWANAYTTLQTAINAASPGDTIYLKGETFTLAGPNPSTGKLYWGPDKYDLTIIGGYQGIGPEPGPLTNTATVLRNTAGYNLATNRVLYVSGVTNGTLMNVTIRGGQSYNSHGAGIHMTGCTNMLLSGVSVSGNLIRNYHSGSIYGGGLYAFNSWGTITNSVFEENVMSGLWSHLRGGGMYLGGGGWLLRDCVIRHNRSSGDNASQTATSRGIGIYAQSGIHTVKNCLITRNTSTLNPGQGEAVYVEGGSFTLENATVHFQPYEGIRREAGTVTVKNSIVWNNGDDIAGTVTLQNNCIEDGDGNGSNGNLAADPQFERGLFLSDASPCVNAGSTTVEAAALTGYTTRADGTVDTDTVDIGYHFLPGTTAADYYVDAAAGDNSNNGLTPVAAFKTITKALSVIGDGSRIHVAAGLYNVANGETFPLTVSGKYGVQICATNAALTVVDANTANTRAMGFSYVYPEAVIEGLTLMRGKLTQGGAAGGGLYLSHVKGAVRNCIVKDNVLPNPNAWGALAGAGIYAYGDIVVSNCVVRGNSISGWYPESVYAGGICVQGNATILNCVIVSNTAYTQGGSGYNPSVYGGGLYLDGVSTVRNTLFQGNNATLSAGTGIVGGDAAFVWGGNVTFENCTVVTNGGEGIRQSSRTLPAVPATVLLRNSIVWANGDDLVDAATSTITKRNNAIEDGDGVGSDGNIQADPLFVNASGGNFRLSVGSPCVNAGTNQTWMGTAPDLDGNARVDNDVVDLGCYEQVTPLRIVNRPAGNVTAASADFNGTIEAMGPHASVHLYVVWGPVNQTTNWDDWAYKTYLGTAALKGDISTNITFIGDSVTYYYAYVASNDTDIAWAQPSETILTEQIRVVATAPDAAELGTVPGTFTVYRSDAATDVPLTANFILSGSAQNGVDYALITPSTVTIPIGATNATVTVTPLIDRWIEGSEYVTLTLAPGSYVVGSPSSDTVTIADWTAPAALYVRSSGDGTYATNWASAFTSIQSALNNANAGDTVYVAGGTYTLATQIVWQATGVTIRGGYDGTGTPGEPSAATPTVLTQSGRNRILYLDSVVGGSIENLTIAGGVLGHTNPAELGYEYDVLGAGIYMNGCSNMVLSALTLRNNSAYVHHNYAAKGGGIYAANSWGSISNCLLRSNVATRGAGTTTRGAGVCIEGGGWMIADSAIRDHSIPGVDWGNTCQGVGLSLVSGEHAVNNCLITRNLSSGGGTLQGGGIYVGSGTTTVANVTLYWNAPHGLYRNTAVVTVRDSILWDNGDDVAGTVTLLNNAIEDGDANGADGNIASNPLFERGLYLAANSPCVDAGSTNAAEAGVAGRTTQVGGTADTGLVDMGYHFAAGAADYYVDVASGSDANSGTDAGSPLQSITKALARAADGTHIHVAAGNYTAATETFPLSFSYKCGLQLLGAGSDVTVLNAQGAGARVVTLAYNYPDALVRGVSMINANWSVPGGNWGSPGTLGIALYAGDVKGVLAACVATNNTAPRYGGGGGSSGYPAGTIHAERSYLVISNCVVAQNNTVSAYAEGYIAGGISVEGYDVAIANCSVISNRMTGADTTSYGFGRGSGLYLNGLGTVRNCLIYGNSGFAVTHPANPIRGQGAYVAGGTWVIENCTLVTNWNRGAVQDSQGLYVAGGTVTVRNSILWGNGDEVVGTATLRHSNIEDGDSVDVDGNLSENPLFVDPAGGDFRLQIRPVRSPSLNAGEYQIWMDGAADLDGNPRIQNKIVDMGAYEILIPAGGTVLLLR